MGRRGCRMLVCAAVAALVVVALPGSGLAAATADEVVTSPGPVVAYGVTPDLNCSASYAGDVLGEFFGDTACATVIAAPDALYAPADVPAGFSLTTQSVPFIPLSQSRSGSGSTTSPFAITTTVLAGDLRLTQVDSYATGSSRIRTVMTITNTAPVPIDFDLFRAGDCFAKDSDTGYGQMGPQSAACVSAVEARTVRFLATPLASAPQPEARTFQGYFNDLWARIGTFTPAGARQDFDGSCRCAENIDNSAGLQWRISLAPGQQTVIRSAIDFGPIADPGGFGNPVTAPPGGRPYVALGDSFSSGEGAGAQGQHQGYDYFPDTNAPGVNVCHRSRNAYPVLISNLFGLDYDTDVRFRACSGAVIANLRGPQSADHGGSNEPAQKGWLGADTQLVTLTIGGNDARFSDIVKECVIPLGRACDRSAEDIAQTAYAALGSFTGPQGLAPIYQEILDNVGPGADLVVFGYPDFTPFYKDSDRCNTAAEFTEAESTWLSGWIRTFNTLIAERAARAGAIFVDVDRLYNPPTGRNHRICSGDEWVNGVRGKAATESFHPNKLGQEAFFNAFRRVIINGEPNEALSGGPGAISFARQSEIATSGALDPTTVVIRKGTKAAVRIDVAPGQTTTASLRYNGAVPSIDLTDAAGTPIPIAAMDPAKPLNRIAGASAAVLGNTTAVELRGMAPGSYLLNVQLPDGAPTDAGVLSVRFTRRTEVNLAPIASVSATLSGRRALRLSAAKSTDPEGERLSYRWTFGVKKAGSDRASAAYRYRKAGRYRVGLVVTDPAGAQASQRLIVETRPQKLAALRVTKIRGNALRLAVSCSKGTAVGACQVRLKVVLRPQGGRRSVRLLDFTARPGKADTQALALPAAGRRAFAGTVRTSGIVFDQAVRTGPRQNLKAQFSVRRAG